MFDCRAMPNPYWDESLRGYTGRDKLIAEFFDRTPPRSVYFAERMTEWLADVDGVEIVVSRAVRRFRNTLISDLTKKSSFAWHMEEVL